MWMGIGVWHAIWSVFVMYTVRARYFLCGDSMDLFSSMCRLHKFYAKLSPLDLQP